MVDKPYFILYTNNIIKREREKTMTVYVKEKTKDIIEGVDAMKRAMIADYGDWCDKGCKIALRMWDEYADGFTVEYNKKYVRISVNNSVSAFIVAVDNDKKFKKGDILKPAGWKAPARNFARGNVFDGGYEIRWTGA